MPLHTTADAMPDTPADLPDYVPRAERISFDLMVRYRFGEERGNVLLRNLTRGGARIEGLAGLRAGDEVSLQLPALSAAKQSVVVWVLQTAAGLEFRRPLHPDVFEDLVHHHALARPRTDTDRMLQIDPRPDDPEDEGLLDFGRDRERPDEAD
ncbi:MAG TPA: PilZ domain-containing protein [Novosphingobium sp.]|nr:PilZ domain-containing protein [Novosphingobium sp.]